jgi:hypothetical protein
MLWWPIAPAPLSRITQKLIKWNPTPFTTMDQDDMDDDDDADVDMEDNGHAKQGKEAKKKRVGVDDEPPLEGYQR